MGLNILDDRADCPGLEVVIIIVLVITFTAISTMCLLSHFTTAFALVICQSRKCPCLEIRYIHVRLAHRSVVICWYVGAIWAFSFLTLLRAQGLCSLLAESLSLLHHTALSWRERILVVLWCTELSSSHTAHMISVLKQEQFSCTICVVACSLGSPCCFFTKKYSTPQCQGTEKKCREEGGGLWGWLVFGGAPARHFYSCGTESLR